jgi:predicted glycogen debranching enzyme
MLDFGREICGHLATAERREWLVTNGIGGYASGTVAGVLTRRYHGLLMAAMNPPLGRTLLLVKLDETITLDGQSPEEEHQFPLYLNRWATGEVEPNGHHHLNRFRLEGTTPVWEFACADAILEKRIWMQPGANTTYVQYRLIRANGPLTIEAKALVNYRDYHSSTVANEWKTQIMPIGRGVQLQMFDGATPFYLLSDNAQIEPRYEWYEGFFLSLEEYRGQNDVREDHVYGALIRTRLQPGETVTVVASTEEYATLDGESAYADRRAHEQALIDRATRVWPALPLPEAVQQLVLAADQFVVKRPTAGDAEGHSIIAGYHWFGDWGRDSMIALSGVTLATGRPQVASSILRTFAQFVDRGMLPNRFPDHGEEPEYNTVDATLWYFEAIRAYYEKTGDDQLLHELFPVLADIIRNHRRGTRYHIRMDEQDGLIYAGEGGVQLTWMDAKVGDWVVTPRIGKPVEINALWFNALCVMCEFAQGLGYDSAEYEALAAKVKAGFGRFWSKQLGYCYDVLDGPNGNDGSLRPNQLLAISLTHSPLNATQQKSVVDICARRLLTAHGLRSLSPGDNAYIGHYGGDQYQRDSAYHQGTVWGWLIGPFVSAYLRVYQNPDQARSYLMPLLHHLADHGVGSISEIFDGDAPFAPRGCIAQAWSVAELLRAWRETLMS